jgi:hypothetical protein
MDVLDVWMDCCFKICTPSNKEAGNVKASGHYQTYGINIQAVCDSKCRFISVCIAARGGCNVYSRIPEDSTLM